MEGAQQTMSPFYGMGAAKFNHGTKNEHKEVRCWIAGEGQGLSEEDESRINIGSINVNESHVLEASVTACNPLLVKQKNQSPIPIVQWERFLPLRTLKVLLVENDDSTRQVVSALLRNCCYEVTSVPNVLEAWRILEDLKNHIDIVLTEVITPCFSGVGLLCKIMSHKTYKTIPVIMMSSNDSMGIVFKCLSKGAVDFLVKPIRKNELKNLWQHVWRRCHSSSGSGSGSESGIQGKKFTNSKSEDDSDNNTDSNDKDNGSIGWNVRDGSDNGSGTQSSWTKRAMEVDSPQSMSPSKQLSAPHDSTCAQFIHPKPQIICSKEMPVNPCMDLKEQEKIAADDIMGKDLDIGGTLRNRGFKDESYQSDKVSNKLTCPTMGISPDNGRNAADVVRYVSCDALHERNALPVDWLDSISDNTNQQFTLSPPDNVPKNFLKISENKDKGCMDLPSLEQSLKRLRSAGEVGTSNDERNVLRRSNPSAFSRYPSSAASVQDNSSGAAPLNQGSNGSSDNNDMGSTNKICATKPGVYKDVSASSMCNHPASAFHPVQPQSSTIHSVEQEKIHELAASPVIGQSSGSQKQVQVQHHHHHYHHHHHHHVHALPSQPDQDESSHENLKENIAICGSSNAVVSPVETNAATYSLNGSNSSGKQGSDGHNGCTAVKNMGETNIKSASCLVEKDGLKGGDGSGCSVTGDQNRCAQREAALNKFRQKRKARNFSKKVRYQSRKRLAEQRPRFHGQFVRRIDRSQ